MRSSNELGSDGVYIWALCGLPAMTKQPTKVYWSSWTTKLCSQVCYQNSYDNVSTFQTPTHGPLGLVIETRNPLLQNSRATSSLWSWLHTGLVPIISAYAGMTDELIDMLDLEQLDGLVISGLWADSVPKETAQKLENLLQKKSQSPWSHDVLMVLLNLST